MKCLPYVLSLSFLGLGLAPLGCGHGDGALGEEATLTGTIEGWNQGEGYSVSASAFDRQATAIPLSTAPIDATGTFHLPLPKRAAVTPYLLPFPMTEPSADSPCASLPKVAPAELKIFNLVLNVIKPGSNPVLLIAASFKPLSAPTVGGLGANLLYADRDARITGEGKCSVPNSSFTSRYEVDLGTGWNTVVTKFDEYSVTPSGGTVVTDVYTGPLPAEIKWQKGG